jgi:membrane protease YdiL (CAAX protease family)
MILVMVMSFICPWINFDQAQDTGFSGISQNYEYIVAFLALVVIAPFSEEIIFRGYLFSKLKKYLPIWAAIIFTSVTFGAAHMAWNLAIDTFALSVVACVLREMFGSIWPSILIHMMKNGLAYYLLFINPDLLTKLVG